MAAIGFFGVFLGLASAVLRAPTDAVTEREMNSRMLEIGDKLDAQSREIAALRQSVNQLSTDTAGIAMKVGVTAHPVTAPSN